MKNYLLIAALPLLVLNGISQNLLASDSDQDSYADSARSFSSSVADDGLKVTLFDQARLQSEYRGVLHHLDSAVKNLNADLVELHDAAMDLKELSDDSASSVVQLKEFLSAVRRYEKLHTIVEGRIKQLPLAPSAQREGGSQQQHPVNYEPLVQHYLDEVEQLHSLVTQASFTITLPNDLVHEQVGIDCTQLRGMKAYSEQQIEEMRDKRDRYMIMPSRQRTKIDKGINRYTASSLRNYISTFGTSNSYRIRFNEEGAKDAAAELEEVFWARSYLRATYGIKIGSIPVKYEKRIFNTDYFLSNVTIGNSPVRSDQNLTTAIDFAREASKTLHVSHDGWAGWILYAAYPLQFLTTTLAGKTYEIDTKRFIIDLVKRDLEEEKKLGEAGGLKAIRQDYRDHFYKTPESEASYRAKEKLYFPSGAGSDEDDDIEADVVMLDSDTLRGTIEQCRTALETLEIRLEQARILDRAIELYSENNAVKKRRRQRQDLL